MNRVASELLKLAKNLIAGGNDFYDFGRGSNAKSIFRELVEDAQHEYGHGGYTGTIAEKSSFKIVGRVDTMDEAYDLADEKIDRNDKWGPAFAIEVKKPKGYLFFGIASS